MPSCTLPPQNTDQSEWLLTHFGYFSSCWPTSYLRHTDEVEPGDARSISGLLIDQVEFADVILINKVDTVSAILLDPYTWGVCQGKRTPGPKLLPQKGKVGP